MKEETIDIFNYMSGKDKLPPHLAKLGVMKRVMEYATTRNMASPEQYAEVKKRTNLT